MSNHKIPTKGRRRRLRRLLIAAALVAVAAVLVGVPIAASAHTEIDGFELDGNAAGTGANDWDALGSPLTFTGFRPDPTDGSDVGFGSGQTKDTADISQWTWEQADVTPAKSDIVNDYAAVYAEDGHLILYFGQNRQLDNSGDANVGFWLLQNDLGLEPNGTFSGVHADGDLLVQSEFTNGGAVSGIRVYKWQNGAISEVTQNVGQCANGKLAMLDACAIVNSGTIPTSWAGNLTAPFFFEGGVNLSALFPESVPCFSTFLTNTRTSQAESGDLKDFGLGSIDTCASLKITKQATPSDGTQFGYSTTGGLSPAAFSLASGQSQSYTKLQPGPYSVVEDALPAGWTLENLSCPVITGPGTSANVNGATASITLGFVGHVECTYTNKQLPGSLNIVKSVTPTTLKEPGGTVDYTVTVENTSLVNVTVTSVVDDKFGNLANVAGGNPAGCFAVPFVLAPGASSTCTFPKAITGSAGEAHVNVATVTGTDAIGSTLTDSDDARVDFTPRLIDLVILKNATSPTPLNGIVTYTMTVSNKGPDTATNVQLADPAPAGIRYLSVVPGAPTCTVTQSLLTCSLGTLEVGQSRTITLKARALTVGRHTNTATVTGSGGRETNPADNTDSAVTVVPTPSRAKPKPVCLTLTATPKMVTADGRPDALKVRVTRGKKKVNGTQVRVVGAGVKKSARSKASGVATLRINPRRAGVITITARETKQQQICGQKRIGAVGVFLPPLTG